LEPEKETSFSARLRRGILLSTFLVFFLNPVAQAHPAQDQGLAASTAEALTKGKTKRVVVFDFMGPDDKYTQLGVDIADGFSQTLASVGGNFAVIDRHQVRAVLDKNRVAPRVIRDPEIAWWLARQLKADALIVGELTAISKDTLRIAVAAANTKWGKEIASLSVEAPFTLDMIARSKSLFSEDQKNDWLNSKSPKELIPKCIYCPQPDWPGPAIAQKKEGTVSLIVLVTEDGIAKDIDFVEGQQYGLTQKAIEAVQKWKFQPGQGPDGKPRPVWQQINVAFRFMK
jgi:TonB family protein